MATFSRCARSGSIPQRWRSEAPQLFASSDFLGVKTPHFPQPIRVGARYALTSSRERSDVCTAVPARELAGKKDNSMNTTASMRVRVVAAFVAALALSVPAVLTVGVGSASAHDQLLSSTPADGAALDIAPHDVTLEYSDSVLTVGAIVLVVDSNETNWVSDEPVIDGWKVSAQLRDDMPDGAYEIRWRVVSVDGHPISGIMSFTVGNVAPETQEPTSAPATPSAVSPSDVGASSDNAFEWLRPVFIGVGGAAAAVLLLWAVTVLSRRRASRHHSGTRST